MNRMLNLRASDHLLEYAWHGPSPSEMPTIVFLHEGLGCVAAWGDFPARLSEATGCGALVYSRAGYGGSDSIMLPRPVRFMHEEALITLPQVLEVTGVREAILFGHSDGGSIALIHAGGGSSNIIRAVVLEAPHVFVEEISVKSIAAAADKYCSGNLKPALEHYHGKNVECAFWGWNRAWLDPEFRAWNIEEYLPRIRVPVLVIQGQDDEFGTERQVEAIERGVVGLVRTVMLSSCGHSPHRIMPQRTLNAASAFILEEVFGMTPQMSTPRV